VTTTAAGNLPRQRPPTDDLGPVPAVVAGRFRVRRVLQRRAGVATLVAVDSETGQRVVLKVAAADALPRGARLRLLHEAQVLRTLAGAGLVTLIDAGEMDGLFHLAMPYVAGDSLAERLAAGRLSVPETLRVANDVLSALALVHARGILHRDIKPGNIMVGSADVRTATLIDFGLARTANLDASLRDEAVGSARYMSPEQSGLVHRDVDERSDLYALGVVLFQCLTGRPPFEGRTVGEVLRQHLSSPAPDVRSYVGDVPGALAQVVKRLLHKDPRDRYQSAGGALEDVREIEKRILAGDPDPTLVLGLHDRRATLTEPAFVGRQDELERLEQAAREAAAGRGGLVLLEAESGGGKSRLLDEIAFRSVGADDIVLRGQGEAQVARPPFQLLEGVVANVVALADRDEAVAEKLRASLSATSAVLRAVVPALAPLLSSEGSEGLLGPEEFGEARALAALTTLLAALGDLDRGVIVLLDDCQWADEPTVRLLSRWSVDPASTECSLLIVAAFRSEEVAGHDPLRSVQARRIALSPFAGPDVRSMVESMAGRVPAEAIELITQLASGSPFMTSAVLRGLVESGALFHDGSDWRVDQGLLADAQSSREAAQFLTTRLELLDADALRLLGAGAVLGKSFDVDLAAALVDVDAAAAVQALQPMRARHLLWLDQDDLAATFVHDKLREALLARLSAEDRGDLHARSAALLVDRTDASPYDLAYHFHAAGDDAAALPHALRAAAEARARHALSGAEQQYRIALAGVADDAGPTRRGVLAGLGEVLMLAGRYSDAADCLGAALDLATDSEERAEIALKLGELTFKRGEIPASVGYLERALESLGRHVPRRGGDRLMRVLWEGLVQIAHCVLPNWARRHHDPESERGRRDILAARIYSRLAYSYWFAAGRVPCAWSHFREMNILERYPPSLELAQAYSEHAPVMSTLPWFSRGIRYAERSLEIRRSFGDIWGQGQSLHFYGVVLYGASRFEEATEKLNEAIRLLERTGDQWEINTALWHIGYCSYRLGRLDEAAETLRRCYANGVEIGDHQASAIGLAGLAKITGGEVDAALIQAEVPHIAGDIHTEAELLMADAIRLLGVGDPMAAVEQLDEANRRCRQGGVRSEYVAPVGPWLLTALRVAAEEAGAYRPAQRRQLLDVADTVARRANRLARAYRNNLPHVLRERAAIAQLRGDSRRAERLLDRAEDVARSLSMAEELRLADELRSAIRTGRRPRGPIRAVPSASTPEVAAAGAEGPSLGLADRFDTLLRVGRDIATTLQPSVVYDTVRVAATELLRCPESAVVVVDPADPKRKRLVALDRSAESGFSHELVLRALAAQSVILFSDDGSADPVVSSGPMAPRSALAAPIFVRGRIVACWYVLHRQVTGLFGPEERRLAEFLSVLAGAALENAEGFSEVRGLSQSLERRVEERTAELSVANNALRSTLAELETANAELRRLDEMKSDFVAMVSHELRSPLTSILGYCSTMVRHWDKVDDSTKQSFIGIIDRQSHRLSGLVNDLLEMSRIESGQLGTRLSPMDLRPLLEELASEYSDRLPDLAVSGDLDTSVVLDPEHFRRVLINLVDNAMKYGERPVSISVVAEDDMVSVAVRDAGAGVPGEFRARLFQKFAQASSGSTRSATGTGLGLSIVKGLVEAMAGTVRYEPPAAGRHGGFIVSLPRAF
jgi:signal transduction histidine kinase/tetratricopeptide (TPR) repeat protein